MQSHSTSTPQGSTRRDFLIKTTLAVAAPLGCGNLATAAAGFAAAAQPFIRVRENPQAPGWKYYRVDTVASHFPASEDEKPFLKSAYGGDSRIQWHATGKFRLEKVDRRWWLVDPDGHPFLSCGVNTVAPHTGKHASSRVAALGGDAVWSKNVIEMLRGNGFNTAGYWSRASRGQRQTLHEGMPYVFYGFAKEEDPRIAGGGTAQGLMHSFAVNLGIFKGAHPIFHPGFEKFCGERCEVVEERANDPWLLGYFTDNELNFMSLEKCLECEANDPVFGGAASEARRWMNERFAEGTKDERKLNVAWMAHVFDWYFRITTTAIRKYDPNHLQLGSRLFATERHSPEVFAAAGRYLDVVSINPYGLPAIPVGQMRQWATWAGDKPLLIGEFYVKGLDAKAANRRGAGLNVATQEERGLYYQNFVLNLLRSGVCVGWHWHRYSDDEGFDGAVELAANKGIVGADLAPYADLIGRMEELNSRMHAVVARMPQV